MKISTLLQFPKRTVLDPASPSVSFDEVDFPF